MAGIAEDVSDRMRMSVKSRERQADLSRAQSVAKLAHVITRPDGSLGSWSESLPRLIGAELARMIENTRDWLSIVHPDDRKLFRNPSLRAGAEGTATHVDYRLWRSDGQWIHVHQEIEPLGESADPSGELRWFNTIQNVTHRHCRIAWPACCTSAVRRRSRRLRVRVLPRQRCDSYTTGGVSCSWRTIPSTRNWPTAC